MTLAVAGCHSSRDESPGETPQVSPPSQQQGESQVTKSEDGQVYFFNNDDPEMQQAQQRARETFGCFWREIAWERRRIVPALEMACIKVPFSDDANDGEREGESEVEQMWVSEVDFDGKVVTGILINSPNWLTSVKQGDPVSIPLSKVNDWMYAIDGKVYGAFTVNLMRSRMAADERAEHDDAWGLEFGDPKQEQMVYKPTGDDWRAEHPASISMASSLKEHLAENPDAVREKFDGGWTQLHHLSLAGSAACVKILLDHGADPKAVTDDGMTPLQLAESLGWNEVAELLRSKMGE